MSDNPLRDAIQRLLDERSFGLQARALAAELGAEPPVDEAVPLLERLDRR